MSDPDQWFDVNGKTLRRRINCTIAWTFVCAVLLAAVLVLQAVSTRADSRIEDKLNTARTQFSSLESMLAGNPTVASAIASQQFFRCTPGVAVPHKWIILGSPYARGLGAEPSFRWYNHLRQYAGAPYEFLVPGGETLDEQFASLQNDTRFQQWLAASEPLLVFVEQGHVGSLASIAIQLREVPNDPRAMSPVATIASNAALLRAPWLQSSHHRIVFLVPTLPYAPLLGGFVPPTAHVCTDPLALSLYNFPDTFVTMEALSRINTAIASTHAMVTLALHPEATVQVLTTESLFANFGFSPSRSLTDLAFADDCLSLNGAGQRLLARYLWACLQGLEFHVPESLQEVA